MRIKLTAIARYILAQPQFIRSLCKILFVYWIDLVGILLLNVADLSAVIKKVK